MRTRCTTAGGCGLVHQPVGALVEWMKSSRMLTYFFFGSEVMVLAVAAALPLLGLRGSLSDLAEMFASPCRGGARLPLNCTAIT